MRTLRPALAFAALALLAGCNKSDDTGRSATGEVLQGTISDDMLPTDKVTSEAPLAEPAAATGKGTGEADTAGTAATDTADEAEGTPSAASSEAPADSSGQ